MPVAAAWCSHCVVGQRSCSSQVEGTSIEEMTLWVPHVTKASCHYEERVICSNQQRHLFRVWWAAVDEGETTQKEKPFSCCSASTACCQIPSFHSSMPLGLLSRKLFGKLVVCYFANLTNSTQIWTEQKWSVWNCATTAATWRANCWTNNLPLCSGCVG